MQITLMTDYRGALRQREYDWESFRVDELVAALAGHGVTVVHRRFEDLAAPGAVWPRGEIIAYTSSQVPGYKRYLDDLLYELQRENTLIPGYDLFRAHENKVQQELLRRRLDLPLLPAHVFGNLRGLQAHLDEITFPVVFKTASGFMSSGVSLIHDSRELVARVREVNRPRGLFVYEVKYLLKQHVFKNRYHAEMYRDCVYGGPFVLQRFLPDAPCDWRVLATAGDRLFVVRRGVRDQDFRASGSGRTTFPDPPERVLDLAVEARRKLDVPMVSLDVLDVGGVTALGEFQATHFSNIAQRGAPHCWDRRDGAWRKSTDLGSEEEEFAGALARYLAERSSR